MALIDSIKRDEGKVVKDGRHRVYQDSLGLDTVGYGRLVSRGFSEGEVALMLENDLGDAASEAHQYPWFTDLDKVRQDVITSMIFNLGPVRFSGFKLMINAMSAGRYDEASSQMLASKWAEQVGDRANRYARIMLTGVWV